jgi:hypothetical protein
MLGMHKGTQLIRVTIVAVMLMVGITSLSYGGGNADVALEIPLPNPAPPSRILSPFPPPISSPGSPSPGFPSDNEPTSRLAFPAVPPLFVYIPELGYYVAIGTPYDIAYIGSEYFMFSNGFWYSAEYYGGSLMRLEQRMWPPLLARHKIEDLRRLRDAEFKRYNRDRDHYNGRLHTPAVRNE